MSLHINNQIKNFIDSKCANPNKTTRFFLFLLTTGFIIADLCSGNITSYLIPLTLGNIVITFKELIRVLFTYTIPTQLTYYMSYLIFEYIVRKGNINGEAVILLALNIISIIFYIIYLFVYIKIIFVVIFALYFLFITIGYTNDWIDNAIDGNAIEMSDVSRRR